MHINKYAAAIYKQNVAAGWWDDMNDKCIFQTLQLVSTEIAEATEGERKDLMDNHLPLRKSGEVELADALIRVLDIGGRFGWEFQEVAPHGFIVRGNSIGKQHLGLNMALVELAGVMTYALDDCGKPSKHVPRAEMLLESAYSSLVTSILYCAAMNGYSIYDAMDEKLVYNAKREDHKRENRSREHGKKF